MKGLFDDHPNDRVRGPVSKRDDDGFRKPRRRRTRGEVTAFMGSDDPLTFLHDYVTVSGGTGQPIRIRREPNGSFSD